MKSSLLRAVLVALGCIVLVAPVQAGKVFDDLLNYPVLDQQCPAVRTNEGLSLAGHGGAQSMILSKENPLGQTITVGPKADVLWRICVAVSWYPHNWQVGEEVTFTLWNSPSKTKKLYSRTLDFDHKWFKWDVPFDIQLPTKPNAAYYFELTHNGGADNSIPVVTVSGNNYKRGVAYVAGKPDANSDLYFVLITKPKGDRKANLRKFINRFDLSDPQLAKAKVAYKKGDLDGACNLILAAFESRVREKPLVPKPVPAEKLNTLGRDLVCDESRYYHDAAKKDYFIGMTDQTTWRETWPDSASYVRQNDLFRELGEAYQTTKNEKYAVKLNALMRDFMQDNASPYEGGMRGGRWVAMFVGWRTGDAWECFGAAMKSKGLTADVKLGWIDYWCRMGHFVELEPSGANQENASAECLMSFAFRFPEFADSKKWQQQGYNRLMTNSLDLFRPDGGSKEPTMNYVGYALGFLLSGLDTAKKRNLAVPAEMMPRVEKIHEYIAYILDPSGQAPANGDTNCIEFRPNVEIHDGWRSGHVMRGADWFKREDLRYIATMGKEGTRPSETSHMFPDTRYAIMRSDWGGENGKDFDQARYLLFRAGYDGGHSHSDYNQVTLYAYGRTLLMDPGRSDYGTPVQFELGSNRSHNVLLVDGMKMNNPDPTLNCWRTGPVMDFIDNTYKGLYDGVDHTRAVVFVRPDYYIMFDHATSNEPRKMGINFWLTPPDLSISKQTCEVNTNEPDGSNLLVKQVIREGIDLTTRNGTLKLGKEERSDIPVATFWRNGVTDACFTTVLYPYPKGAAVPKITPEFAAPNGQACVLLTPLGKDVVCYSPEPKLIEAGIASVDARAGLVRLGLDGAVTCFAIVDGSSVSFQGKPLATCANRLEVLSVVYTSDTIQVTCPKSDRSLEIAPLGKAKALVNGKEIAVTGETFKPFGG